MANIAHFARALRRAGLGVGPDRVQKAVEAVALAGFTARADFYWVLHACFVSRPEERETFDQVFGMFWRDPRFLEQMMPPGPPAMHGPQERAAARPAERRAAEALLGNLPPAAAGEEELELEIEADASGTTSGQERLRRLDFAAMSARELAEARAALARLTLPVRPLPSRRLAPDPLGRRADWSRTLRLAMRRGGEVARLERRKPRPRWPDLVVLCDISGSMSAYSRVILHFLHVLSNRAVRAGSKRTGWRRVHGFTFGTRLTNITRHMRARDVDAALAAAGAEVQDWEGGTRIGACLRSFNRDWSRRVLGPGAVVILITDGLERDPPARLAAEMERLHLSARRVIWVNPLLRWEGFAPRAAGIRAMLPHVDSFRAGHNIDSLAALAGVIASSRDTGEKPRLMRLLAGKGS